MNETRDSRENLNAVLGLKSTSGTEQDTGLTRDIAGNENTPSHDKETTKPELREEKQQFDTFRFLFFGSIIATISFTTISLLQPAGASSEKQVHLITFAAGAFMLLMWLIRGAGARLGLFPDKNIALKRELKQSTRVNWIDSLDEPALLCDKHGVPVQCNSAYEKISAFRKNVMQEDNNIVPLEAFLGASSEDQSALYQLAQAVVRGGRRERVFSVRDQRRNTVQNTFILKVAAISHDRFLWRLWPEEQKATSEVIASEIYKSNEEAPLGFFVAKADGKVKYMNAWMRNHLRVGENFEGIDLEDLFGLQTSKPLIEHRKIRQFQSIRTQLKTIQGRGIPVQAYINWSGEGAQAAAQVFLVPQTRELPSSEADAKYSKDAQSLIESAPFGALTLSGATLDKAKIESSNGAFTRLYEGRDFAGKPLSSIFLNTTNSEEETEKSRIIHDSLMDAVHKPIVFRMDTAAQPYVQVSVMLDEIGRPILAYVFDLTEQRALEERLAQGEKMQAIGQLAGGIAHDFNNVLQGIVFNTDQLKMRHPVGDPSYENLKKIMEFVQRSKSLTRQLLAYAREQTFKHEIFNPTEFLTDFERLLRQTIDQRITLNIQHGEAIPWIKADKNQIETAIINLAANARDAMLMKQNSGTLNIRTFKSTGKDAHALGFGFVEEGEYLLIEVEDNGNGIAPENMQKIFNPFFTTKPVGVGTGLGLASVMGIIKQSGGFICPTSTDGEGTIFRIYLPALRDQDIPAELKNPPLRSATSKPKDITGRGRILFVEDEDGVRGIGANLLRSRGYDVTEAEDGDVAFEIIESEPIFDLIITDVVMPGRDGPTLINDAKDMLGNTQVVFISGYADQDLAKKLDAHKEVQFLPKPFSMRALAELVKEMLGTAKSEKAA